MSLKKTQPHRHKNIKTRKKHKNIKGNCRMCVAERGVRGNGKQWLPTGPLKDSYENGNKTVARNGNVREREGELLSWELA